MQNNKVLEYLEDLAFRLGIEIVNEKLGGADFSIEGGLCKVKGVYKIFIDPSAPIEVQIEILVRALSSFQIEGVYLLPFIREILEKAQKSSQ
ncbi:MAG: hypothetical protein DRG66_02905 [Deltaproteobacteria bacterium]|nr:MAG: hypothetical protein DRG66_02905 [Deltaproteobacteria bacterium]